MGIIMGQSRQEKQYNLWRLVLRRPLFNGASSSESSTTRCLPERQTSQQGDLVRLCRLRTWRSPSGSIWCAFPSLFLLEWGESYFIISFLHLLANWFFVPFRLPCHLFAWMNISYYGVDQCTVLRGESSKICGWMIFSVLHYLSRM